MIQFSLLSLDQLDRFINWIKERLWVRPLAMSLLSLGGIFIANLADDADLSSAVPDVSLDSVTSLLSIMASSMLIIATFAVGSMVSAYASASTAATPRSFPLVLADDVTQNALSAFVGAFIFSLVSLVAVENDRFGSAGLFTIFALTVLVFVIVIGTFVRWVDRIARLGRVTNTIEKVEKASSAALERRRKSPTLGALPAHSGKANEGGIGVCSPTVGYVQHIDMQALQSGAEKYSCRVLVKALPGTFVSTSRPLLLVEGRDSFKPSVFEKAFTIGRDRAFEDDPRFGLVALAEIGARALSSGINDPGTAINIIGTMVRLFTYLQAPLEEGEKSEIKYDRIMVPRLDIEDLFDDAFTAIARDGAGIVEVSIRLQKAFCALSETSDELTVAAARKHSRMALLRSEQAMSYQHDIELLRNAAALCATQKKPAPGGAG